MTRVLRWALDGSAALSLLLCAGACALWARSYRVQDQLTRELTWFGRLGGDDQTRTWVGRVDTFRSAGGGLSWKLFRQTADADHWEALHHGRRLGDGYHVRWCRETGWGLYPGGETWWRPSPWTPPWAESYGRRARQALGFGWYWEALRETRTYNARDYAAPASAPEKLRRTPYAWTLRQVFAPWWSVALAAAALPGWRLARVALGWRARRRRPARGSCRACGYDLTGNESGVCPECGAGVGTIAPEAPA